MFCEHLVPGLGCELIAAEPAQPNLVLQRHPQEGDPSSIFFDPLDLDKLA
jgi:hypothetical protein